jgi:hypothetical protein
MCDLWWAKWHWGRFSASTSVSPANLYSTNCSTITIIWGWYNRPVMAALPSGLSLTIKKNIQNFLRKTHVFLMYHLSQFQLPYFLTASTGALLRTVWKCVNEKIIRLIPTHNHNDTNIIQSICRPRAKE